MYFICILLDK